MIRKFVNKSAASALRSDLPGSDAIPALPDRISKIDPDGAARFHKDLREFWDSARFGIGKGAAGGIGEVVLERFESVGQNYALVRQSIETLVDDTKALAQFRTEVEAKFVSQDEGFATSQARFDEIFTALATATSATAKTERTLTSRFTAISEELGVEIESRATIEEVALVESTLEGSIASLETTLRAEYEAGDAIVSGEVTTLSGATADKFGHVETFWGVKQSINGAITAMVQLSSSQDVGDVAESQFKVVASEFLLEAPDGAVSPPVFTVDTGTGVARLAGSLNIGSRTASVLDTEVTNLRTDLDAVETVSVAEITIYIRSASAPSTPTGGNFDFDTLILTPPIGWSGYIPPGTDPVYASITLASIIGGSGTDSTLDWTAPVIAFQDGADGSPGSDGAAGSSVDIIFKRSATQPSTPSPSAGTPATWYSDAGSVPASADPMWSSVGTKAGGVTNFTWQMALKIEGEDGAPGVTPGWDDITGRPGYFDSPSGSGLFLADTHMGYYSAGAWKTYMSNTGLFGLVGSGTHALTWDGTTLGVDGNITVRNASAVRVDLNVQDGADNTTDELESEVTLSSGGIVLSGSALIEANYSAGSTGFQIDGAGSAEFNNVTVRGAVHITNASTVRTDLNVQDGADATSSALASTVSLSGGGITMSGTANIKANYSAGSSGFQIDGGGNAEFNSVTVRGAVHMTSGAITGGSLDIGSGYKRTVINSDGTATFGGGYITVGSGLWTGSMTFTSIRGHVSVNAGGASFASSVWLQEGAASDAAKITLGDGKGSLSGLGTLSLLAGTASTSTTTGTLTITGGAGITGDVYCGGFSANGYLEVLTTAVDVRHHNLRIFDSGGTQRARIEAATGDFFNNGVKVLGSQGAAVADATDAASTQARLNDLLARLRTHGLIAT